MRYKFKGTELLEDIIKTGKNGITTTGFTLSFLGLEYINENYFNNSLQITPPNNTLVFSSEFLSYAGFYTAECICLAGTLVEGISFAYNVVKVPIKLTTGKYLKRDYSKKNKLNNEDIKSSN